MSMDPAYNNDNASGEKTSQKSFLTRVSQVLNDGMIMRTAFYGLAIGVGVTLMLDYREMLKDDVAKRPVVTPRTENPVLPAFVPKVEKNGDEKLLRPAPDIITPIEILNNSMQIELASSGVLKMTGFIDVGTAKRFDDAIAGISEYIKTIELNSPGGSVYDALSISEKIRSFGWETHVPDGNLCASSCPILLAGGKTRTAGKNAGIGVHQFFAIGEDKRSASEATSSTQATTAEITRHLEAMDVDPKLWIFALETPPQNLYYFTPEELEKYNLTTH